jgi:hypothetical protein
MNSLKRFTWYQLTLGERIYFVPRGAIIRTFDSSSGGNYIYIPIRDETALTEYWNQILETQKATT